jgi:hypothetical protein
MDHEVSAPTPSTGSAVRTPALGGVPWHEQVRSDQATTGADQALDERGGDGERRVGRHFEGTTRETEIGRVGANDLHVALIELIPQVGSALCMQLNGDNACACRHQRTGY